MSITPDQARADANKALRALYAAVTDWDRALIEQAIDAIGGDGRPFSMNDVRDVLPETARGAAGLVFHSLVRRGNSPFIKVGQEPSTAASTHGKPINVYVLRSTVGSAGSRCAA